MQPLLYFFEILFIIAIGLLLLTQIVYPAFSTTGTKFFWAFRKSTKKKLEQAKTELDALEEQRELEEISQRLKEEREKAKQTNKTETSTECDTGSATERQE